LDQIKNKLDSLQFRVTQNDGTEKDRYFLLKRGELLGFLGLYTPLIAVMFIRPPSYDFLIISMLKPLLEKTRTITYERRIPKVICQ
jgi:hypothetical protein